MRCVGRCSGCVVGALCGASWWGVGGVVWVVVVFVVGALLVGGGVVVGRCGLRGSNCVVTGLHRVVDSNKDVLEVPEDVEQTRQKYALAHARTVQQCD